MEKSVALFILKKCYKKFEKCLKKLLTIGRKCGIIWAQSERNAQKQKAIKRILSHEDYDDEERNEGRK